MKQHTAVFLGPVPGEAPDPRALHDRSSEAATAEFHRRGTSVKASEFLADLQVRTCAPNLVDGKASAVLLHFFALAFQFGPLCVSNPVQNISLDMTTKCSRFVLLPTMKQLDQNTKKVDRAYSFPDADCDGGGVCLLRARLERAVQRAAAGAPHTDSSQAQVRLLHRRDRSEEVHGGPRPDDQ